MFHLKLLDNGVQEFNVLLVGGHFDSDVLPGEP